MSEKGVGFLGLEGSNSEEAGIIFMKEEKLVSFATIPKLIKSFVNGGVGKIILPIENSIEGIVTSSIDNLIAESKNGNGFLIEKEVIMRIRHHLIGIDCAEKVKTIISHPQALAQCDCYIEQIGAKIISHESTSGAAKMVSIEKDPKIAAIAGERAAEIYGLKILKRYIQDSFINATRFIVFGNKLIPCTVWDKTSFFFILKNDLISLQNI